MNKRDIGSFYEDMAADYLRNNHFQILERNYHCRQGEIDIIAQKNHMIHFIEVKYRKSSDYGYALETVDKKKQQKIKRTALWYVTQRGLSDDYAYSFDVISIQGDDIIYNFNCFGGI